MFLKSLSIFLFVAIMVATSTADAQNPIGVVNGTLYCPLDGFPGANVTVPPIIPTAAMQVACTGDMAGVSWNTTTDSNGGYLVVMIPQPNLALPVNAITSNCHMYIRTPLANCNMSVVSNLELVRTVTMGLLRIAYMVATNFTPQP